ncbi:probable polyol transporter 4 [Chenopodium quinoa]|uniref:probable polyol transporter 4 n=1 Tax=Chenopodium quinoa TaxID=63459 RepID=UPI000B797976|nr:probable polyol transporter 4 [Chenopodium quinoa]
MGLDNESSDMSNIDLGSKNKYKRMDAEVGAPDSDSSSNYQEKDITKSTRNYVMACAFFASVNSILLGYDVGVMSGAIIFIQEELKITDVQQEVLVGCLSIVSLIGSLAGGRTSDAIGRKWTMAIGAIIFQLGGLIMTIAYSFRILMVGRLLSGIGIGFGATIMGVYIAEISPAISRGFLTTFPEICINIGILLGYVSNYAFSGLPANINWRVMLALGILPSVIIGFALFIIPESPRWLVLQNRTDEARTILMNTIGDEKEVAERLDDILQTASKAKSMNLEEKAVWREIVRPSPAVYKMLAAGVGLQCFQQITGIDALVYYSPTILKTAGIEGNSQLLAATVAVGVTKTAAILVALFLIDRVGRKPLLYTSTIGITVCLFCITLSLPFMGKGPVGIALAILFICGDVAFFSVGIGPICWVLTSEIYPLRIRAQAVAVGFAANRVCSGLVSLSFLSLSSAISVPGTFFIFSALSAISVVFVHKVIPETKGKTLEEIECLFNENDRLKEGHVELADTVRLVS